MKLWVCSLLLLLIGCNEPDTLSRVCPEKCYNGPEGTADVGSCRSGKPICNEDNSEVLDCVGEVHPSPEICDQEDNDCNGVPNDLIYPTRKPQFTPGRWGLEEYPCKFLGECRNSLTFCNTQGEWECSYYGNNFIELQEDLHFVVDDETRCDGRDNDCDGVADESVFDRMSLNERVCYSGNPIESLAYAPCRAGVLECIGGQTICLNEQVPAAELCDNVDNDCNGVVDDAGDVLSASYDIVFIIDTSGSMCDKISAVANALASYSQQFENNPNFRFALVLMSSYSSALVNLDTNFADFTTIYQRLVSLGCSGWGAESSLDSMEMVCNKTENLLSLAWRPNANGLFFAFTDESPQTYTSPPTTGQDVIDACIQSGVLPFVWSVDLSGFAYIAQGANGQHFGLVANWQKIFDDMNSIIITLCGL